MKILMFGRESDNLGGVVNYINVLKSKFRANFHVTDFTIGYRKGDRSALLNFLQPLRDGGRLLVHMMSHRYDIIHINPSLQLKSVLRDGFFISLLKLFREDNLLVFFHGWDARFLCSIKRNRVYSWVFRKVFSCRKILVLAAEFRDSLVSMGFTPENIEVASTLFDGDLFAGASKQSKENRFQVLFLSRLIVEKGIYELLDAFTELTKTNDNLRLVIAGDGPEFEKLSVQVNERNLQSSVHMAGYVRDETKANIMVSSDLFILPSYSEGCPVSLLEAMAASLPVIGSRVGAIPDIIKSSRNGIIIDSVSKDEIFKSLSYYIDNPDAAVSAGEHNRKLAWEQYEASIVTRKLERTYEEITHG